MYNPISLNTHGNDPKILLALREVASITENKGLGGNYYMTCALKLNGVDIIIFSSHYEKPLLEQVA